MEKKVDLLVKSVWYEMETKVLPDNDCEVIKLELQKKLSR